MTDTTLTIHGVTLDTFIDGEKFIEDVTFDRADLNDAFLNQASLMAYYGTLAARAMDQVADRKIKRDLVIATVAQELRTRFEDAKPKLTEASLIEMLDKDPRVRAQREVYNKACLIESEAKAAVDAIRNRRDMLIQMGAHAREEMKGQLRMTLNKGISSRAEELKKRLARTS